MMEMKITSPKSSKNHNFLKNSKVFLVLGLFLISTISISSVKSQNSEQDDCPEIDGNSTKDRVGCIDSDGDGWSNPDDEWTINNGADVFIDNPTQWKDSDKDGFGDNSNIGATNIDYWPNDRLRHKPVLLIACEPASNTIIISESSSFFCKVTNPMHFISVHVTIEWVPQEGISSEWNFRDVTLQANGERGYMTMFSIHNTGEKLGLSGGEVKLWVDNQEVPSAIAKLPILVINEHPIDENELAEDIGKAFSFSRMHDGVEQVAGKLEESSGISIPTWTIYFLLILMFSLSLKKPAMIFSKKRSGKQNQPKIIPENIQEEEAAEPPYYIIKRTKPVSNSLEENINAEDDFDYVPKRLR